MDNAAVNVGQPIIPALLAERQAAMIQAQTMQDGRIQIVNVDRITNDIVAVVIRLAVHMSATDSPAGQPH